MLKGGAVDGMTLALAGSALVLGVVHTLAGPDHYVPFLALSRARRWGARKTLWITAACGLGHIAGSLLLVAAALLLGLTLEKVRLAEEFRGGLAGWLILGFGLAYLAWGLKQAFRSGSRHEHEHTHPEGDGDAAPHSHEHSHTGGHVHAHLRHDGSVTPWVLFLVFVFGPCEPLIPLVFVPAASGRTAQAVLVAAVFGCATVLTMLAAVGSASAGLSRIRWGFAERYGHALAGALVTLCGVAVKLGL